MPEGSYECTGYLVAPGGSVYGTKNTTTYSTAGASGGGTVWFNNYPVVPGDVIKTFIGAPNTNSSVIMQTVCYVNDILIAQAWAGGSNAASYGASIAGGQGSLNVIPAGWVQYVDWGYGVGGLGGGGGNATASTFGGGGGGAGGYHHSYAGGKGGNSGTDSQFDGALSGASATIHGGGAGGATNYNGGGTSMFGLTSTSYTSTTQNGTGAGGGERYLVRYTQDSSIYGENFGWGSMGIRKSSTRTANSTTFCGGRGGVHLEIGMGARLGYQYSAVNLQWRQMASLQSE